MEDNLWAAVKAFMMLLAAVPRTVVHFPFHKSAQLPVATGTLVPSRTLPLSPLPHRHDIQADYHVTVALSWFRFRHPLFLNPMRDALFGGKFPPTTGWLPVPGPSQRGSQPKMRLSRAVS
jgi:hypothetical protein